MTPKKGLFLLIPGLILFFSSPSTQGAPKVQFSIVYTNDSRKVTVGVCRNCHTEDQSPAFNYLAYIEKIGCKIIN